MTDKQAEILELIAGLPLPERQALIARARQSGLLDASIHAGLTPEQRDELTTAIAEAERGDVMTEEEMFERLESQFAVKLE
jgi:hypothetical protein